MQPAIHISVLSVVFFIVAAQGIFLALILSILNKGNMTANRIMALFVGCFSFLLCYYVLFWTGLSCNYMWTKGWCSSMPFLFGPFMYLYIYVVQNGNLPSGFRKHLIPFAIHFSYMVPFIYWFTAGPESIANSTDPVNQFLQYYLFRHLAFVTTSFKVFNALQFASMLFYFLLMMRTTAPRKLVIGDDSITELRRKFSRRGVWFFGIFAILFSFYWIGLWIGIVPDGFEYGVSTVMSACIYMIGYSTFRQPQSLLESKTNQRKLRMRLSELQDKTSQLIILLEQKQPWLDNDLNLHKLAAMLKWPSHELSYVINESLKKNFADLLHTYRIREACRLLGDEGYAGSKILHIAFDVGYSNKATFNAAFKSITGMSPSAYRQFQKKNAWHRVA